MRTTRGWGAMAAVAVVALLVVAIVLTAVVAMRPSPAASAGAALASASASSSSSASSASASAGEASASASAVVSASAPASSSGTAHLPGLPDPHRTPGVVNPAVTPRTIDSTICVKGWTATVRPPASYTTALKRRQIAEYGYTDTALRDYEEDHLISLELGGDPRDPANLWPEPYSVTLPDGTPVGARVKDQLENRLNDLVCSGEMPLATAQHLIATDWIAAWRQHVAP